MPYPNEHALRLKPPGIFDPDSFKRTAGGTLFGGRLKVPASISLIWAKLKGRAKPSDPPILQAIRFPKKDWSVAAAKNWIKKHIKQAGSFEPAKTSTAKAEELTLQDKEQDILFGDYDEYDAAEAIKFEELGDSTMTLDDIEDDPDPEQEARRQHEQLMAVYDAGAADAETRTVPNEREETGRQDYAASTDSEDDKKTYDIHDVEVMAVGTWKGDVYTQQDLDQIAKNFPILKAQVKPPLVLGHDDEQGLLQASGLPAAGWVSKLRRVGNKLLADFSDVPRAVASIIKRKGYKRVSVEVYPNYQAPNGLRYGLALARIALLGAAIPAIKTLRDVEALYSENLEYNKVTKEVVYMAAEKKEETLHEETEELEDEEERDEQEETAQTTETATPDKDKVEDKPAETPKGKTSDPTVMAELRQMMSNYEELKGKLEASNKIIKVLQDQLTEQKEAAQLAYDEKFLDDVTAEGKLPPAVRGKALKLMGELRKSDAPVKYTELDEQGQEVEKEETVLDMFKGMVGSLAVTIDMAETATGIHASKPGTQRAGSNEEYQKDGFPVVGADTVDLVQKRVKELQEASPGKSDYELYSEALLEVSSKK